MEIMESIGQRLREVREAMGMSQTEFSEVAAASGVPGATRQSQAKYEKGLAAPSAPYLAAVAAAGGDVLYILTGSHDSNAQKLDPSERVLLDSYRACPPQARQNLIQTAVLFAAGIDTEPKATKNTKVKVSASGGYAAGRDMQVSHREEKESEQANNRKPPRTRGRP